MHIICCVDNHMGMSFNGRRCSSDIEVLKDVLNCTTGKALWLENYTLKLFVRNFLLNENALPECIHVDDNALEKAQTGEYVFCELENPSKYTDKIESVLLYCWNRRYPSDTKLTIPVETWDVRGSTEICGKSHEKIGIVRLFPKAQKNEEENAK